MCGFVCVYNPLSKLEFSKSISDRNVAEMCISGDRTEGSTIPLVLSASHTEPEMHAFSGELQQNVSSSKKEMKRN